MNKNGFLTNLFRRIFMVALLSLMVYGCYSKHSNDANTPTNYMFATVRNSSLAQQITEFSEHAEIYGYRKLLSLNINYINKDTVQYKLASINGFWMLNTDIALIAKVNDIYVLVKINTINDFCPEIQLWEAKHLLL